MMKPKKILTLFILGISLTTGCRNMGGKNGSDCSELLLVPFIQVYQDSMLVNPHATLDVYKKALEKITDSISRYALLQEIATCYIWAGERDSAMMIHQKVIDFCERTEQTPCLLLLQAETYMGYGIRSIEIEEYDTAIDYLKKAVDVVLKSQNTDILTNIYSCLAICHHRKSNYPDASYYYQRALFIADSLNQGNRTRFVIFFSMAKLYSEMDNFDMAEYYIGEAEKFHDEVSETEIATFNNFRGIIYNAMKDYQRALDYHHRYNRHVQSGKIDYHSLPYQRALSTANLAETYLLMGLTDSAQYYAEQAKKHYSQSVEQMIEIPTIEFFIDGLFAMLALKEDRLNEATKILLKPYDPSAIEPDIVHEHHRQLEDLYARKNDFRNAYNYRLKVDAYNDSLRNTKTRNYIAEMDMRYKQDTTLLRKDLRIASVEKTASRWQNIALMCLLALVLFSAATVAFVLYSRRKREREYRRQVAIVTGLRMEIVRNRVSPHFVFNALNVMMPSLDHHKELERPFRLLIEMLRNNLKASEQVAVPLEEEIGLVKNFLQLQEIGERRNITVQWLMADDVSSDVRIPSMAIQIPVENAVKYAFTPDQEDACITIHITRQTNVICIEIDDNGVGFKPGAGAYSDRGTGNGLKMLRRTVELLNTRNQYKMAFSIENKNSFGDDSHGTRVTIMVPMEYQFELQ